MPKLAALAAPIATLRPALAGAVPTLAAAGAMLAMPAAAGGAILGPHADRCSGPHPAMLVRVTGLKDRGGTLRVQSYGGDPATFLDKGRYLERVDVGLPAHGPVEVCLPVPEAGRYAVSVRHRTEGRSEMDDGGGLSGNPRRSLLDLLMRRKPDPREIEVRVAGLVTVPVVMNYVQGASFRPLRERER